MKAERCTHPDIANPDREVVNTVTSRPAVVAGRKYKYRFANGMTMTHMSVMNPSLERAFSGDMKKSCGKRRISR